MDFTNKTWTQSSTNKLHFVCEASDIGLMPGLKPSPNTVRDPWDRRGPLFQEHKNAAGEVTHWSASWRSPDNTLVVLTIYND